MPVTAAGLERPTVQETFLEIATEARATISAGLNFTPPAPMAVFTGIVARQIGKLYDLGDVAYAGFDREKSENFLLTALCKLTGTARRGASYSEVVTTCTLVAGTTLEAGVHFAALDTDQDTRATPIEDFTAAGDGDHEIRFRAEVTGPIAFPATELTVIATAVTGWTAVNNAGEGFPGSLQNDDPTLRARQEEDLAKPGATTVEAQESDVREVDGVVDVKVLENVEDSVDPSTGLPGHSTEAIVWDHAGGATDNEIAQAIWNTKGGGLRSYGSSSGTALDRNGIEHTVPFTRPDQLDVYLVYEIEPDDDYVGDSAFIAQIVAKANELYQKPGQAVIASRLRSLPFELDLGVTDVVSFALGFAPSPVTEANLPVTIRQIATFHSDRVEVDS